MAAFQIGPFIIHYTWVFMLLAGVITYGVLKKLLKQEEVREQFLDTLLNGVIIAIISNKVSILLFRPELWTENPIGALALSGSLKELTAALTLAIGYFLWIWNKYKWPVSFVISGMVYGLISFIISYWLIRTLFFLF